MRTARNINASCTRACAQGELRKATLAIQSSTWNTLGAINDLVHEIYPPFVRLPPITALPALPKWVALWSEMLNFVSGTMGGCMSSWLLNI